MRREFFYFQAVEGILDGLPSMSNDPELVIRHRDIHLRVLKALQDPRAYGVPWTNKQVTRCVLWHCTHIEHSGNYIPAVLTFRNCIFTTHCLYVLCSHNKQLLFP